MKILFTRFPLASAYGGAEIQTITLMRGLLAKGHAVAFLGSCATLLRLCREEGIPAVELDIGPPPVTKWAVLSFAWRQPVMRRRLLSALRGFHDLDAVCMLSLTEKLTVTQDLADKGIGVLWIEHDRIGRWLQKNPWLPQLIRASQSAVTVAVSQLSKRLYEQLGFSAERIVAIPNGIDFDRVRTTEGSGVRGQGSGLRVGCIARLSPEKGVDVLLKAAADVPNTLIDIVGVGKEKVPLRRLAMDLKISERVAFLPPASDIGERFAYMDALVLPSREHDPFGLVAAEAMACGIPAIVTDACGIAEELTHGKDALIAKADSAPALADAIRTLLDSDTRKQIGQAGKQTALEKFSAEMMVARYETLLRSLPHAT